ncbi:putative Pyridoxal phosphate-dependent transferase [Seiridium unicorne]|uniref:Pyridoxal phosphate-dependent transferase n=1 Tax=Seiridium unicorne TaxID=138068 RepID=A0ABR2V9F8_9PEZI
MQGTAAWALDAPTVAPPSSTKHTYSAGVQIIRKRESLSYWRFRLAVKQLHDVIGKISNIPVGGVNEDLTLTVHDSTLHSGQHEHAMDQPPQPLPLTGPLSHRWHLKPDVVHLDHGSCGGCPTEVLEYQNALRRELDAGAHQYFAENYASRLAVSKKAMGAFLNADPGGLIFTPGSTMGLNIVAQNYKFLPGDEIMTTDHCYKSVKMLLEYLAERDGAKAVIVKVPFPVASADEILETILAATTPRTKFAILDHIVSRTGLVFPIKRIVAEMETRGVDVLVDGAHGPGQIAVDLTDLNAPYYTSSCHKWMCTPRGLGFLHVRADRRSQLKPLVVARSCYFRDTQPGMHTPFEHRFDWMGTSDPTVVHTVPRIIEFLQTALPGGHAEMVRRNHDLAVEARRAFIQKLGMEAPCPDDLIANMATIPLPDSTLPETMGNLPLQNYLWRKHRVEIQVYSWPAYPRRTLRFSCQLYNSLEQYEWLADRVREGLDAESKQL